MVDLEDILVLAALTHLAMVATPARVQAMQKAMEGTPAAVTGVPVDIAVAVKGHQRGQAAALRLDPTLTRELTDRLHPLRLVTTHTMTHH